MKKMILSMVVFLIVFVPADILLAEECPEIDANLRFELYKNFPQYEIAFADRFSPAEQQELAEKGQGCPHVIAINPSLYVILLKAKGSDSYRIAEAETSLKQKGKGWVVREIDVFTDDTPVLIKAKGGFYADVTTGDRMTVTRNSAAFMMLLLRSGKQIIYKRSGDEEFEKCRIR
ncbi:MAG TPA: hypothetical protein ENO11_01300 [Desulfobacteraceae bacterium]|nr:hypothetical protein [Desulfobacteraceae bacterium]